MFERNERIMVQFTERMGRIDCRIVANPVHPNKLFHYYETATVISGPRYTRNGSVFQWSIINPSKIAYGPGNE